MSAFCVIVNYIPDTCDSQEFYPFSCNRPLPITIIGANKTPIHSLTPHTHVHHCAHSNWEPKELRSGGLLAVLVT